MKKIFFLFCIIGCTVSSSVAQKLSIADLTKLKNLSLNNAETLLSQKKFDFKEVRGDNDEGKDYAFSFYLDKYGEYGDEYLVLSFKKNQEIPFMIWYQLDKDDWLKIKNDLNTLGYKKIRTEIEYDGSLSTRYTNSKYLFSFNSGKSEENKGALLYTLSITFK